MTCPACSVEIQGTHNVCPHCDRLVRKPRTVVVWPGGAPSNGRMEHFWNTGDPSVFAAPGAADFRPDLESV